MELDLFGDSPACAFCDIIERRAPSHRVFEDGHTVAFLDHRPLVHGHCLLVPKVHYQTLLDLPGSLVTTLFVNAQLLSRAVHDGLGAEGSFLAINTIVSQSVPHLHVHIIPRWTKDGLFSKRLIWMRHPYRDDEMAQRVQEAIVKALATHTAGGTGATPGQAR